MKLHLTLALCVAAMLVVGCGKTEPKKTEPGSDQAKSAQQAQPVQPAQPTQPAQPAQPAQHDCVARLFGVPGLHYSLFVSESFATQAVFFRGKDRPTPPLEKPA